MKVCVKKNKVLTLSLDGEKRYQKKLPKPKNLALSRQHLYLFPGKLRASKSSSHFNTDHSQISTYHIPFITPFALPTFPPVFGWFQRVQDTQESQTKKSRGFPPAELTASGQWKLEPLSGPGEGFLPTLLLARPSLWSQEEQSDG